jgi:hypothetical protein
MSVNPEDLLPEEGSTPDGETPAVPSSQTPINPDDLHDLFAGTPSTDGSDDEDPLTQLRRDPNYAALIGELEYIAAQARLLFAPAEEAPPDGLWDKIVEQLPTNPEE